MLHSRFERHCLELHWTGSHCLGHDVTMLKHDVVDQISLVRVLLFAQMTRELSHVRMHR